MNNCSEELLQLQESLRKEIEDEDKAFHNYMKLSSELRVLGRDSMATRIRNIAFDERIHQAILTAVVDVITAECKD